MAKQEEQRKSRAEELDDAIEKKEEAVLEAKETATEAAVSESPSQFRDLLVIMLTCCFVQG